MFWPRRHSDVARTSTRRSRFATRAGVIEETERAQHRFVHSLFRDAAYASLADTRPGPVACGDSRGVDRRGRAGEQARILPASRVTSPKRQRSTPDLIARRGCTPRSTPPRTAADQLAWDEAAVLLERAGSWPSAGADSDVPIVEVLARLGDARRRVGLAEGAMAAFVAAGRYCRDDAELMARIALGHEDAYLASGIERRTSGDPSVELLERAGSAMSGDDPAGARGARRRSPELNGSRALGTRPVSSSRTSRGRSCPETTPRRCASSISAGSSPGTRPAPRRGWT